MGSSSFSVGTGVGGWVPTLVGACVGEGKNVGTLVDVGGGGAVLVGKGGGGAVLVAVGGGGHIGYFTRAAEIIRSHHEHFDGSGYPRGLRGEAIPHGARVFAIADALDALTFKRPYREALLFDAAVEEITARSGTVYDPEMIQAALTASAELRSYIGRIVL